MEIRTVEISKLKPAKYNPRVDLKPGDPEYEKLKKSIIEFGYVDPIVWNEKSGNVCGGHQRLKILKELGETHADVSVVSLNDMAEKTLNIALQKNHNDWDMPMLKDLLIELDTGAFDMEITGFDEGEIETLLAKRMPPDPTKGGSKNNIITCPECGHEFTLGEQ